MNIPTALDDLLAAAAAKAGVPWSRDPQTVRSHIAQTGVCLTCDPPDCTRRTQAGWVLTVRLHLVMSTSAGMRDTDHALLALPTLCNTLGVNTWAFNQGIQVGALMHPGFTIEHTLGVSS